MWIFFILQPSLKIIIKDIYTGKNKKYPFIREKVVIECNNGEEVRKKILDGSYKEIEKRVNSNNFVIVCVLCLLKLV